MIKGHLKLVLLLNLFYVVAVSGCSGDNYHRILSDTIMDVDFEAAEPGLPGWSLDARHADQDLPNQADMLMLKQWGEFGAGPGQFKYPAMITVDQSTNIYVVDQHNHRIQKFDPEGNFLLMWGKSGINPGEFNYPFGIAVDAKGEVFVSDMNNHRIQKFSSEGIFISLVGSYGTEKGQFKYPYGIAVDEMETLYVIDAFNYRIQRFNADLKFLSEWGSEEEIGFRLYMPHELAIAKDGNVILSDRQNHRISIFSKEGMLVKRLGAHGEGKEAAGGHFSEPHGVAVNSNGDIFVCDRYNFRVQILNAEGAFQSSWMTSGVLDDSKHFPIGIVLDADGTVYVTDHYAHCIQKYRIDGTQTFSIVKRSQAFLCFSPPIMP